jgi:hypothetical protein
MAATETPLGSKRKFQSGTLIAYGETFKETNKATLKDAAGKTFSINEADEATVLSYNEIMAAYSAWVAAELT